MENKVVLASAGCVYAGRLCYYCCCCVWPDDVCAFSGVEWKSSVTTGYYYNGHRQSQSVATRSSCNFLKINKALAWFIIITLLDAFFCLSFLFPLFLGRPFFPLHFWALFLYYFWKAWPGLAEQQPDPHPAAVAVHFPPLYGLSLKNNQ